VIESLPDKDRKRLQKKMDKFAVRAMIFSEDSLVKIGLLSLFDKYGVTLIGICTYDQSGFEMVAQSKPDLVIFVTNVSHPSPSYLHSIKSISSPPAILVIVSNNNEVPQDTSNCDLICRSQSFQPEDLVGLLRQIVLRNYVTISRLPGSPPNLTSSQTRVLQLLSEGKKTKEVSEVLDISRQAVDSQVKKLHQSFGSEDLHELVVLALRSGLVL
jgi:DNA-binding NarL/FixJ family response regulator